VPIPYVTSHKNWPTTDVKAGKETVKRSSEFPRLTVEELQAIRKSAPDALMSLGSWGTPTHLIVNSAKEKIGERLDRGSESSEKMLADLAAAQKKLAGAATPYAVWRDFARAMADAESEDLAVAVKAVLALDKLRGQTDAMKKDADAARGKLAARGEEKLAEAESADDPKAALKALAEAFKGHPLERKIREKLK
jgi:hypothetical protein